MKVRVLYRPGVDSVDVFFVAAFGSPFSVTPLPVSRVPVGRGTWHTVNRELNPVSSRGAFAFDS